MKLCKVLLLIVVAAFVGAVAYGASVMRGGWSTHTQPSQFEQVATRAMRRMAMPSSVKDAPNPWKATPDVIAAGRVHWADHCATCHANDGSGNTVIGQNLYPRAPDMRLAETQNLTDGELYSIIRNGVRLTGMPGWGDPRFKQDDESWHLVVFIRHLPQITPEELDQMKSLNPKTEADREEEKQEQDFLNGGEGPQ